MFVFCVRNVAFTVLLANVMHFSIGRGNIINVDFSKKFGFKISRGQKKNYESSVKKVVASNKNRPPPSGSFHEPRPTSWENQKNIQSPPKQNIPALPNPDTLPPPPSGFKSDEQASSLLKQKRPQPPLPKQRRLLPPPSGFKSDEQASSLLKPNRPQPPLPKQRRLLPPKQMKPPPEPPIIAKKSADPIVSTPKAFDNYLHTPGTFTTIKKINENDFIDALIQLKKERAARHSKETHLKDLNESVDNIKNANVVVIVICVVTSIVATIAFVIACIVIIKNRYYRTPNIYDNIDLKLIL